jgi:hypothetical protein
MAKLQSQVIISCPIEKVWNTLIDTEKWEVWNKYQMFEAEHCESSAAATLLERNHIEDDWTRRSVVFSLVNQIGYQLQWFGGVPYCLDFKESIFLTKLSDSSTLLNHIKEYHGILSHLPLILLDSKLDVILDEGNAGLKDYLERNHQLN